MHEGDKMMTAEAAFLIVDLQERKTDGLMNYRFAECAEELKKMLSQTTPP